MDNSNENNANEETLLAPAMNTGFFNAWLTGSGADVSLLLRSTELYPFLGSWKSFYAPNTAVLYYYSYLSIKKGQRPTVDEVWTRVIAEFLAPFMPETSVLPKETSRLSLIEVSNDLFSGRNKEITAYSETTINKAMIIAFLETATQEDVKGLHMGNTMNPDTVLTEYNKLVLHWKSMAAIAIMSVKILSSYKLNGYQIIIHALVSLAKRGQAGIEFINRISEQLSDETKNTITFQPGVLTLFYSMYGANVTEENAKKLFETWNSLVPTSVAMRLSLTINQVAGTGLTAYLTIMEAFSKFQTFPWADLYTIIPEEFCAMNNAMKVVGNNMYYGFKKDLGPVRSTLFKSLAYIAKELLIKADDKGSLRGYKGWTKFPREKERIDNMIKSYLNSTESGDVRAPTEEQKKAAADIIAAAGKLMGANEGMCSKPPPVVPEVVPETPVIPPDHENIPPEAPADIPLPPPIPPPGDDDNTEQ